MHDLIEGLSEAEQTKEYSDELTQLTSRDPDENAETVEAAYGYSLRQFREMKAADREAVLFALIREQCASMRVLEMKVAEYEQKVRDMMSPEGIEEMKAKVMEAIGGGGLFKGLF